MATQPALMQSGAQFMEFCESAIRKSFSFLAVDYAFRAQEVRRWDDLELLVNFTHERVQLTIEVILAGCPTVHFFELLSPNNSTDPLFDSSSIRATVTLDELCRLRCPNESGWPIRQQMAAGWPRSSNMMDPVVAAAVINKCADLTRLHAVDLLNGDFSEFRRSI